MHSIRLLFAAVLAASALPASADPVLRAEALKLFAPLKAPPASALERAEVRLGRQLFWDARISLDGKTACASCHMDHGADKRQASPDAKGIPTSRHSPTVFNAIGQVSLRWLGDRKSGAEQAESSMVGSMGFASKQVAVDKLVELHYAESFKVAYPEDAQPLNARNYGRALEAYQATLVTPSAFDRFLEGDDRALDARQKAGLRAFVASGCTACHSGPLLGGTLFMKFGLVRDYWLETGSAKPDAGRYAITKKDEDKYVFRVPMLRNVARTAPYFHDGSVATLDKAVRIMGTVQLGRALDDPTVASIVAFLESLSGDVPAHYAPLSPQGANR
jgi:cytochrome c peroxidase